jgi:hypothetical protein
MRKTTSLAIVGGLLLAGAVGWAATGTQARVVAPTGGGIDPLQMMISARDLPAPQYTDFSVIFN